MEEIVETWERPESLVLTIAGYHAEGEPVVNKTKQRFEERHYDHERYRYQKYGFRFLDANGNEVQFPLTLHMDSTFAER